MDEELGGLKDHCWHHIGFVAEMQFPSRWTERCCHCGTSRSKGMAKDPSHGRYGPESYAFGTWEYQRGVFPNTCTARG